MDINQFKEDITKCVEHVKEDLSQIRTGRATTELVEDILVNAYEIQSPVKNLGSISVMDANINKGISSANLGFSSIMEGDRVLVKIPDLTEERRMEYVKIMKERIEDGRVSVRQVRQKFMQTIDEQQKSGMSEDEADRLREEGEKIVKDANAQIEVIKDEKEKDLLTI